jgi:hypothetical protein
MKLKLAFLIAAAIALPLLLTAAARAGGNPGFYPSTAGYAGTAGFAQPMPLPPITVTRPPSPFEMFATGLFDIVAAPIGLVINVVAAPFVVATPFQQPIPLAYAAPQQPIIVPQLPAPRYEKRPGWYPPQWQPGSCYDGHGRFAGQSNPECTQ